MNYTNGFDTDAILPVLESRVGWRSESPGARSFESFHALCTEDNLSEVWPKDNIAGDDFDTYKANIKNDVIQRCLSSVFSEPEYIEQALLHNRVENSLNQTLANGDFFCGIRLNIAADFEKSVWVKNLTLLFDGDVTFNIYLFKQGTPAPIKTKSVTATAGTPAIVDLISDNWILNYGKEQATVFYIGYFQSDLGSVKAIREQVCMNRFKVFDAVYVQMQKTDTQRINQSYVSFNYLPYGLTAEVHSFRDYTQKIIKSANLFDEAIGLSMVYYILELIVSTTRSNATERVLKGSFDAIELKHYLYGSVPAMGVAKTTGLNEIINQKFEQLRNAFHPKGVAQSVKLCL